MDKVKSSSSSGVWRPVVETDLAQLVVSLAQGVPWYHEYSKKKQGVEVPEMVLGTFLTSGHVWDMNSLPWGVMAPAVRVGRFEITQHLRFRFFRNHTF